MTIHREHPFRDPDPDPLRLFRGRVGGTVSLWTAGEGVGRAGLTVTSFLVAAGEDGRVLGLLDPDADLTERLAETGRAVVQLLSGADRDLADVFAGVGPAPGGMFRQAEFIDTEWGPRLGSASSWAGVRLETRREVGWSALVTTVVEHLEVAREEADEPLWHRRGRYGR